MISFKPVDLPRHATECIKFREDSFVVSFGDAKRFYEDDGQGAALDRHAMSYFKALGLTIVRLSVSPTNTPAIAYYKKMNWQDLGPRPGHPDVHFMEKVVD